jgi:putative ABC transport system permease protein
VAAPAAAIHDQMVIVFMVASATALGGFGVVGLAYRRLTSSDHQLRLKRLVSSGEREQTT